MGRDRADIEIAGRTMAEWTVGALSAACDDVVAVGRPGELVDRTSFDPVVESEWDTSGKDGRSWFSADTSAALIEGLPRFGPPA